MKGWNQQYSDKGLTIIGILSPELDIARQGFNLAHAIQHFRLPYRVALDSDFKNWTNYRNRFWPSLYAIDREGYVRFNHIGEGNEQQVEAVIQQLLAE